MRYIVKILLAVLLFGGLLFASYYKSKSTALELVGNTLEYFPLSKTRITLESPDGNNVLWMFKFSFPDSYDEDLYVYTNLLGGPYQTKPKHLESMLRCFEKQELHPYSKEFIELSRQRSREGINAEVLCK